MMKKAAVMKQNISRGYARPRKRSISYKRHFRSQSIRNWRIISNETATIKLSNLSRIQLDDQLLVDDRLHFVPSGDARDFAAESVAIDCKPVGHRSNLGEVKVA